MQSLLAGRLPFRVVVMIVVDMISIGLTPSNRIMSILPSSAGADGGLSWYRLVQVLISQKIYYLLFPSNLTENRPEQDSFGGGTSLSLHDAKLVQRSGYFHRLRREHAELDR